MIPPCGSAGTAGDGYRHPDPLSWDTTHGDTVTVWKAHPGDWRWHVQAANGEVVGHGEGHTRREAAVAAAKRHHPPVVEGVPGE